MAPKIKITREKIIDAALSLVREVGEEGINARAIAARLGASTQPIFSNFSSMEELKLCVIEAAQEVYKDYLKKELDSGKYPPYKSSGMAYIRFADEETELFKLLFMRSRTREEMGADDGLAESVYSVVQKSTGLVGDDIKLFHLEMWACVHGVATMLATEYFEPSEELISKILTDTYLGLRRQYGIEG